MARWLSSIMQIQVRRLGSLDDDQRLDQISGLVFHQHQCRFHALQACKRMGDQLLGMDAAGHDQTGQPFTAQATAGHQTAPQLFVTHTAAPFGSGNADKIAFSQIVHVADNSTGLQDLHGLSKGAVISAGNNDLTLPPRTASTSCWKPLTS